MSPAASALLLRERVRKMPAILRDLRIDLIDRLVHGSEALSHSSFQGLSAMKVRVSESATRKLCQGWYGIMLRRLGLAFGTWFSRRSCSS
jgi:hypothetical protein